MKLLRWGARAIPDLVLTYKTRPDGRLYAAPAGNNFWVKMNMTALFAVKSLPPARPTGYGLFALMLFVFASLPVKADEVPVHIAAKLQAALSQFISDASAEDGSFTYLDRQTARRQMLYPASKHPMIIPFGTDYYLCVTMLDAQGKKIDVDFLLRAKGRANSQNFMVVETFIDERELLNKALERN